MTNMSYCRFQNTSNDLRDCVQFLKSVRNRKDLDLTKTESYHVKMIAKLYEDFLDEYERLFDFLERENEAV